MKNLIELSADDLETLRAIPKPMSQQNREDESQLPGAGVKLIFGIVVGLGLTMFVVGAIWRFLTR